jgi:acetyl-CoA carboxylase biotin carboxylase subunit
VFETVLVANRGEIACRVFRTCHELGIKTVAVYSEADTNAKHVRMADEAILIGPANPAESYLDVDKVLEAAKVTGAQAIHPGYGFLSENAAFARKVVEAGIIWIGPDPESIEAMGDKITARNLMQDAGVPVAPGTRDPISDPDVALAAAEEIGYPVIVKASAGGGGIGMSVVHSSDALIEALEKLGLKR